jgi:hypothetical protein
MKKSHLTSSILGIIALQILALAWMGRLWVCDCESIKLWYGNAYGPENSQQFFDPYTFSHVVHGLLFFLILSFARIPWWQKLLIATGLEVGWEILENTPMTIERYRSATASLGYTGDSILNSVMDTVSMLAGYWFAMKNRVWVTILLFVAIELIMLWWIRDNLTLNIIMLLSPLEFIRDWQQGISL